MPEIVFDRPIEDMIQLFEKKVEDIKKTDIKTVKHARKYLILFSFTTILFMYLFYRFSSNRIELEMCPSYFAYIKINFISFILSMVIFVLTLFSIIFLCVAAEESMAKESNEYDGAHDFLQILKALQNNQVENIMIENDVLEKNIWLENINDQDNNTCFIDYFWKIRFICKNTYQIHVHSDDIIKSGCIGNVKMNSENNAIKFEEISDYDTMGKLSAPIFDIYIPESIIDKINSED